MPSSKEYYQKNKEKFAKWAKEARERRLAKDPDFEKRAAQKHRDKDPEKNNAYHRAYRLLSDAPQKAEARIRESRKAAIRERRLEAYIQKEDERLANRTRMVETVKRLKAEGVKVMSSAGRHAYIASLKVNKVCHDCGGSFPTFCLDFDHRDPEQKVMEPSKMCLHHGFYTKEQIDIELSKCDIVCANCHRIRTNFRQMKVRKSAVSA